jgi:hypothetical protein
MGDDHQAAAVVVPTKTKRSSVAEWYGSDTVIDNGSLKAVTASEKETLCFRSFAEALSWSQLNWSAMRAI